jgi:NAD-dependent DNA ligase
MERLLSSNQRQRESIMAKDYILRNTSTESSPPAFVQRAMTWAKATNEITGLIRGILADGVVTESEAKYLREWINSRPALLDDSLVRALSDRIERIFDDGIVTPEELEELKIVLEQFTPEGENPTTLPLDTPPPKISIPDKTFCFTGTFVSGTRAWCEDQITVRGGECAPRVSKNLNVLVIGSRISGAWRNQTYGRKIEEAVTLRDRGIALAIVCEEYWLRCLKI